MGLFALAREARALSADLDDLELARMHTIGRIAELGHGPRAIALFTGVEEATVRRALALRHALEQAAAGRGGACKDEGTRARTISSAPSRAMRQEGAREHV